MISRRSLMSGILAAGVSPWIVKSGVLMPVKKIIVPPLFRPEFIDLSFNGPWAKLYEYTERDIYEIDRLEIGQAEFVRF